MNLKQNPQDVHISELRVYKICKAVNQTEAAWNFYKAAKISKHFLKKFNFVSVISSKISELEIGNRKYHKFVS